MEDINNKSTVAIISKTLIRPRLLMQALAFTGILYFCVGQAPPRPTEVINQSSPTRSRTFGSLLLPPNFENYLLQHASKQLGLPTSVLRITHAQSQIWSDNCLELGEPEIFCNKTPVPGWQVEVQSGEQTWIYRTNASGTVIKIDWQTKTPATVNQLEWEQSLVSYQKDAENLLADTPGDES